MLINHGNPPVLTLAGTTFLETVENILFELDGSISRCKSLTNNVVGKLAIQDPVMDSTIANQSIDVFMYFSENYPNVDIDLIPLRGKTIEEGLRSGEIDAGYLMAYGDESQVISEQAQRGIVAFPLRRRKFSVWMSKSHPLARKTNLHVTDLAEYPILIPADRLFDDWRLVLEMLGQANGFMPKFNLRVTTSLNGYFALNTGEGVVILSDAFLHDPRFLMRKDMETFELADENSYYTLYFVYLEKNTNPSLDLFATQLRQKSDVPTGVADSC